MKHMKLMILAADPLSAMDAQRAGVDRIFYDLEWIGKNERQHGRNTVISNNDNIGLWRLCESLLQTCR